MQQLTNKRYGTLILAILVGVGIFVSLTNWAGRQLTAATLRNSPVWTPWAWYGVACVSEIDLQEGIPFNLQIMHPPTQDRDVVNAAMQELPEQNGTKDDVPYVEETLERYLILKTFCYEDWKTLYANGKWGEHPELTASLYDGASLPDAEYRKAILDYRFPQHRERAEAMFPLTRTEMEE